MIFAQWRSFVETNEGREGGIEEGGWISVTLVQRFLQDGPHNTGIYNSGVSTPSAAA